MTAAAPFLPPAPSPLRAVPAPPSWDPRAPASCAEGFCCRPLRWLLCGWPLPLVPQQRFVRVLRRNPDPPPHEPAGVHGDLAAALREIPNRRSRVRAASGGT